MPVSASRPVEAPLDAVPPADARKSALLREGLRALGLVVLWYVFAQFALAQVLEVAPGRSAWRAPRLRWRRR